MYENPTFCKHHVKYVKRYKMVVDTGKSNLAEPSLPEGYFWTPWRDILLATHAEVKYLGFHNELDSQLFPTFSRYESCLHLMKSVVSGGFFMPEATWLIGKHREKNGDVAGNFINDRDSECSVSAEPVYCACIQGMLYHEFGAIQNIAVRPEFRQRGLGTAIVLQCLHGFRRRGISRVSLDVTAHNTAAIQLYQKIGFEIITSHFRQVSG